MAVHVFTVDEDNYKICIENGIVGLPEPKNDAKQHDNIFDALLSRLAMVKNNDYVMLYVLSKKELRGVWQIEGVPFYDSTKIWKDKVYPFRCKIKCSKYSFKNSISLNDINDLRNNGKIWTWSLTRATGTNAMFSITDQEFQIILNEFVKMNPFSTSDSIIPKPYPYHNDNILDYIHTKDNMPKYEYSLMTLLNHSFVSGKFKDIFGNYSDFLSYVPTNLGREMDIVLMFNNPLNNNIISSYDIIEVKRDEFDSKALMQIIDYESWFLQKKVSGDIKMIRTTAIAKSFSNEVIDYTNKRTIFEKKPVKLLKYSYDNQGLHLISEN